MRPQPGQLIHNKYRLVRLIGDGGMGSVYEAKHEVLGTSVALKFLHPELSRRSGLVQRFLQEARVSARIQSPHVVRVTDVDQTPEGLAFIVMEYLEGRSLQTMYEDLYREGERLGYADALDYAVQMMEGVEAAHAEGIVHRDLKPDNVFITKDRKGRQTLKVLDFGIAKLKVSGELEKGLTRPGVVMGTPEYMAPEQAFSADAVDVRADIFSIGVMVFEMLAGRRPVGGDEAHAIAAQYLTGNIAKLSDLLPSCPSDLANAVHKAMAANPEQRFSNVAEFRAEVEPHALRAKPGAAGANSTPPPAGDSANGSGKSAGALAVATTPASVSSESDGTPPTHESPAAIGAGASPVPKTIPPEEMGGEAQADSEASPHAGTAQGLGGPQPEGDGHDATEERPPAMLQGGTEMMQAGKDVPATNPPVAGASPAAASIAGAVPPTETAAPLDADQFGATVPVGEMSPMAEGSALAAENSFPAGNYGATEEAAPYQRPGGTAVGGSFVPPVDEGPAGPGVPVGTVGMPNAPEGALAGGTVGMPGAQSPYAAEAKPAAPATVRKKKKGLSMGGILLIAGAVAAAVVGGAFVFDGLTRPGEDDDDTELVLDDKDRDRDRDNDDDDDDDGSSTSDDDDGDSSGPTSTAGTTPTAPTATAKPQPTTTAKPQPTATAKPQPTTTAKPQPTTTAKPQPTNTSPQPTARPTGRPGTLPPFVLPSAAPTIPGIPGLPGFEPVNPNPPPPATSPQPNPNPPPGPAPTTTGRPTIKIPGLKTGNLEPIPRPTTAGQSNNQSGRRRATR